MEYKSTLSQLHKRIDQCLKKQQQSHQDEEAHRPPQLPLITQLRLFKFFKKKKKNSKYWPTPFVVANYDCMLPPSGPPALFNIKADGGGNDVERNGQKAEQWKKRMPNMNFR